MTSKYSAITNRQITVSSVSSLSLHLNSRAAVCSHDSAAVREWHVNPYVRFLSSNWPFDRVTVLHLDFDGHCLVVTLRTATTEQLKQPISKLAVLSSDPTSDQHSDADSLSTSLDHHSPTPLLKASGMLGKYRPLKFGFQTISHSRTQSFSLYLSCILPAMFRGPTMALYPWYYYISRGSIHQLLSST